MSDEPRVYTREECRRVFLDEARRRARYWLHASPPGGITVEQRIDGAVFSVLCILDGVTDLPGFDVIPHPHPDDRADREASGENWWPDDVDIAGGLHDEWNKR